MLRLFILVLILSIPSNAFAHRSGCHRKHSCPSDRGTYTCGDTGHCSGCPDNQYCQNGSVRTYSPPVEESVESSLLTKQEPGFEDLPIETDVKEYTKITGAFGVTFGETVGVLKSNGLNPSPIETIEGAYFFQPEKGYKVFSNYLVRVTPKSRKIFNVGAFGKMENKEVCETELKTLERILNKKYGKPSNQTDKFILINQEKGGIRAVCKSNSLNIYYLDFELQDQARKEKEEIEKELRAKKEKEEINSSGL